MTRPAAAPGPTAQARAPIRHHPPTPDPAARHHAAVHGQLHVLQHSCRQVRCRSMCDRLRADQHLHMRSGAPDCIFVTRPQRAWASCSNALTGPDDAPASLIPSSAHASQCVANCTSCSTAGAGKCDPGKCASGYGLTSTLTCAAVSMRPRETLRPALQPRLAHLHARPLWPNSGAPPPPFLACPRAAVRGQLRGVQQCCPRQM